MSNLKRSIIILHITVVVWGFTGILGALISVNEYQLVWYRVLIAAVSLGLYCKLKNISLKADVLSVGKLLATGLVLGLHWMLFFGAIKASNISVTMVCLSSLTLFTSILEPLLNRVKILPYMYSINQCMMRLNRQWQLHLPIFLKKLTPSNSWDAINRVHLNWMIYISK